MSATRAPQRCALFFMHSHAAALALLLPLGAHAQTPTQPSYFEFGTVVALGRQSVDIQTFDPQRQRVVQHSFALTRDTRADIVHVGDSVEVVFTPSASDWTLRRLIVLPTGIPINGPPPREAQPAPAIASTTPPAPLPRPAAVPQPRLADSTLPRPLPAATVPQPTATTLAANQPAPPKPKPVHKPRTSKPLPAPVVASATPAPLPKPLPTAAAKPPTAVVPVALGSPAEETARAAAGKTKSIAIERPAEECNRSSEDWPQQPLRIAVLDFRYPTEREEAHDIGTTGGGSGTAVADLVFSRLELLEQTDDRFLFSRGDRRRLDRSDFAGAARLGRQLGVDAVLAGTFVSVPTPGADPTDPFAPKSWELREGIVDTCTGQLLQQTSSVSCPGAEPGLTNGTNPATCAHLSATAKQTEDPKDNTAAFKPLLDDLLYPLEHNGTPVVMADAAALVRGFTGNTVTLQLAPHSTLKPGDTLAIHASRLAKNPTTYTLQNLQNAEIGRVVLQSVQGTVASGTYTGDYPPRPNDTAELLTQ